MGTNVYHSIQAGALADAEWSAAKQELIDLSAAAGLTDVASLIDRDGTHYLDTAGPGGAASQCGSRPEIPRCRSRRRARRRESR